MNGGQDKQLTKVQQVKAGVGPGSASLKYDILTALLTLAAQGEATVARLALRLALVITARYNWQRRRFAIGRRELARMWGVSERTAKREMAEMRARGWIVVAVPAARGRVAQYEIDLPVVMAATRDHWHAVGPDFAQRMMPAQPEPVSNVVPLKQPETGSEQGISSETGPEAWRATCVDLERETPAVFAAWIAGLEPVDVVDGVLTLRARNRFQATYVMQHHKERLLRGLYRHARLSDPITGLRVVVAQP